MKRKDLYAFRRGLEMSSFQHPRITYAINKNKRLVRAEISDMEKAIEPSKGYNEFVDKKTKLAEKYALKDTNGHPKFKQIPSLLTGEMQVFYDVEGQNDEKSDFRKELAKLEKQYKSEITVHEEKVKKYNEEFLNDESDFAPYTVNLDIFDGEQCPQKVMDLIFWMIEEPTK